MKRLARAFFMCLGMFTAIPLPWRPWDEDARPLMILCLPAAGAVVGLLWALLAMLSRALLPMPLAAALIAALPWLLTGFMHLDGYMDASDALLSWRPLEKRLEILKDVHAGALSVVSLGVLMLMSYGAAASLARADLRMLALIPVISRCCSALCVITLRPIGTSQYAHVEGTPQGRVALLAMWGLTMILGAIWLGRAIIVPAVETCAYAAAMAWAVHTLKGVSGDVAGFALSIAECAALMALAVI